MFNGKTHCKWPFSIATLVYQRVEAIDSMQNNHRSLLTSIRSTKGDLSQLMKVTQLHPSKIGQCRTQKDPKSPQTFFESHPVPHQNQDPWRNPVLIQLQVSTQQGLNVICLDALGHDEGVKVSFLGADSLYIIYEADNVGKTMSFAPSPSQNTI